ncbi:MAG: aspartate kinase [Rhodobacteraceae bacterium]|nr:aspartate kinase [Paracoccaceae bacterium]
MKFGGTSVGDMDRLTRAARRVRLQVDEGRKVIAIVSAMAGETNRLIECVQSCGTMFDAREYDAVVANGENVTAGLLAITLQQMNVPARSWQGWQVPVRTSAAHGAARIVDIGVDNVLARFAEGMKVAVVAGFQGVTNDNRIATLGRGGSDLTAVAFAARFGSRLCSIHTDVDGVYTADPRIVPKARKLDRISYEEMLEMASLGAKVLQSRSVELAMQYKVPVRVLSSFSDSSGTLVCDEDPNMELRPISGIAHSRDEAKVTIVSVADRPGIAATVFGALADSSVNVDMIVQNISEKGRTDITFSCPVEDVETARQALANIHGRGLINYQGLLHDRDVCKISVVGIGMRSQSGVAAQMFSALAQEGINIQVISTSEIKISVLVGRRYLELAVQALHDKFQLDRDNRALGEVDRAQCVQAQEEI